MQPRTLSVLMVIAATAGNVGSLWLSAPVVTTEQGQVRGVRLHSGHNTYYSIPYAVAQRFKPPQNPPKWEGIYDATKLLRSCAQKLLIFTIGYEDCLFLDVYTPKTIAPNDKLPVMVFFHGGAYYWGGKTLYNGSFLVEKNVIVVSVNYRLSVHGFLCVNGVSNLGLRDQVAALQWVQRNIASFGGDPDNVSLCGQSAGAASAAMHLLSERSEGLFHKIILMSGSALTPWAFNSEPFLPSLEDARKIGPACSEQDIYNVFLNASLNELVEATKDVSVNSRYFKYSPCVDTNSTQPFFRDKPYNIIKSGKFTKVPMMIGSTDAEGITFYGLSNKYEIEKYNKNFIERISSVFSWCSDGDRKNITKLIRSHYFGRDPITVSSVDGLVDYFSDWIAYGTLHAFSRLVTQRSSLPVYNYQFSYSGKRNFIKPFTCVSRPGVGHGDELFYLFKAAGLPVLSKADKLVIDRMTTMFTNFMKYGDPTPSSSDLLPVGWPRATLNETNTMRIDRDLSIIESPRGNFFESILCEYGESGYVPCDSEQRCSPRDRPRQTERC